MNAIFRAGFRVLAFLGITLLLAACAPNNGAVHGAASGDDATDDDAGGDDTAPPTTDGFVFVPHGAFPMGSALDEPGRRENEAQHQVTLTRDFEMMATEVPQWVFQDLLGFNPSQFPLFGEDGSRPVERVSWYDALAMANKLSARNGLDVCYALSSLVCADGSPGETATYCASHGGIASADVALGAASPAECAGFRLPTEAEWEYAARSGTVTPYYSGVIRHTMCTPVDPDLDAVAWYCGNSKDHTHDVGLKIASDWGLYDMLGNVAEWTWDLYARDLSADATDPAGPATGAFHVVRGGSARYHGAARCRAAYREAHQPSYRGQYLGFRLVRTLPPSGQGAAARPPTVRLAAVHAPATPARGKGAKDLPNQLPFDFTRPDVGTPLTPEQIADVTKKITGLWKQIDIFHWLLRMSEGMGEDNAGGWPDYKLFYGDLQVSKSGDVVTFTHTGTDDNLTIPTGKLINNSAAAYLQTGDPAIGRLVAQYSKGLVALSRGMIWTDQDPEGETIWARAIFPHNSGYTEDGRQALIDFDPVKQHESYDWNAQTIPNPVNPTYGDIWVRNMRSQDDVPHIFRTVPLLMRVAQDGADASVRAAAQEAVDHLQGFAQDIVDSGYYIRTKYKGGDAVVPTDARGVVVNLASFSMYDKLIPNTQCDAKLASAFIAYANPLDVNCETGFVSIVQEAATISNYYTYEIMRFFHVAAITTALMSEWNDVALGLLQGMAERVDAMMYTDPHRQGRPEWDSDAAAFLLAAGTAGLPLTSTEAQLVADKYSKSADLYQAWPYWDLWSPSVPEGGLPLTPGRDSAYGPLVNWDDLLFPYEYCWSPFRNPTSAPVFECDEIMDPTRWGE